MISEELKKDLLELMSKTLKGLRDRDGTAVRELSDHIIHNASIFQDELTISMAVIVYALSKMLDRYGEISGDTLHHLEHLQEILKKGKTKHLFKELRKLREGIDTKDRKISLYVQHVVNEAKIKKGSRIYEHGISLAQTAHVLGISEWELMNYIGKTTMYEQQLEKFPIKKRLEIARKLFNVHDKTR